MTEIIQFHTRLPSDEERLAFVDGRLDPVRTRLIEAALPRFPMEAQRIADHRAQNEALRRLFSAPEPPAPPALAAFEGRLRRRLIWLQRRAAIGTAIQKVLVAIAAPIATCPERATALPVDQPSASSVQS